MLKIVNCYEGYPGCDLSNVINVFECQRCGHQQHDYYGVDPCCCPICDLLLSDM